MKGINDIKFPQYISTSKRTVSVVGILKDEKSDYIAGKGYINKDGYIWIYCDSQPRNKDAYPYFWINKEGKMEFSEPSKLMNKAYSLENLQDLSLVSVIENTDPNEKLYDEKEINDMNSSAAFYVPIINPNDDFLKKIVKNTIIQKGIDINRLKGKTDEKYILPNMKAALQNKTKMSVLYFIYWMNLLECNFEVTVQDNGNDRKDPLKNPITYDSYTNKVSKIVGNELIGLNNEELQEEEK